MITTTDEAKKIKRTAAIRTVRLGDMRVSPTSQREFNVHKGKTLLNKLKMEDLGTFTLSFRDDLYWVVDGQHRLWALREFFGEGWEEWEVEAWTYYGLSEEDEAEKFLVFNDTLAVDSMSSFKVGVAAGRPVETDINRVVLSLGLNVSNGHGHGSIRAVSALRDTYIKYGPEGLVQTLWTVREAFGDGGYEVALINGIAKFRARHESRIDPERLVKKLKATAAGVKGILQRASFYREKFDQPLADCVASAISDIYNAGLRGTASLGSWWKDGKAAS